MLLKIDKDGKVQEMGTIAGLDAQQLYAGEFDRNGYFYASGNGGASNTLEKIDIAQRKVVQTITLSQSVRFWDMAIDETGNYFYVMLIGNGDSDSNFNNDKFAKINIKTGAITTIGDTHSSLSSYISLIFSDKEGKVYMMSNEDGFYTIDTLTGTMYPMASTQNLTFYNDGTSCPDANISDLARLSVSDVMQKEGDGGLTPFNFKISFNKATLSNTGFWFTITDGVNAKTPMGIAQQPDDYKSNAGYIAVPANTKEMEITVEVVGDEKMEPNEEFYLDIDNPSNIIIQDSRGVGTIINDDVVSFNVERSNSNKVDANATYAQKSSFYTQIVGRDFDYAVVAYDKKQTNHAEALIENITLKVELFDENSTNDDNLLYSNYVYFNNGTLQSRVLVTPTDDLKIAKATRNARFRVSYLLDGNGSIVYGQYNNANDYSQTKQIKSSNEGFGSSDNFAIRPVSYRMRIEDNGSKLIENTSTDKISLAAEHDYNLIADATQYGDENVVSTYTINKSDELNVSLVFQDANTLQCANKTNQDRNNNPSTMKYLFADGTLDNTLSHNNVGTYALHIQDINWTHADQNKDANLAGCIANSATISKDGNSKSGCNIESNVGDKATYHDITIDFKPYAFSLDNVTLSNLPQTTHNYVYMNNLHDNANMAIRIGGDIIAQGEKGTQLTNFTCNCFAEDLQLFIDNNTTTNEGLFANVPVKKKKSKFPFFPFPSLFNDIFPFEDLSIKTTKNSQLQSTFIKHNDAETNITDGQLYDTMTMGKKNFLDEKRGSSNLELLYNIKKNYKETTNPVKIDFISIEANATTSTSSINNQTWTPTGKKDLNQTRYFYFARVTPNKENYGTIYKKTQNTTIDIEIFCDHNRTWCNEMIQDNGLNNIHTQMGWYTAHKHDIPTDGTILDLKSDDNEEITLTDMNRTSYNEGLFSNITTNYTGDKRTVNVQVNIIASSWLNYHQTANNGIPFWKIKFKTTPSGTPSGIGHTGHKIDIPRSAVPANRLGW
jgi:hypothetical protein